MLDVCLLGTAGMMPLPNRYLTSCLVRYNGRGLLIDSGEGTQIAMREAGLSPKGVDVICFTHYHADHISGLPGMLLSMANADREEKVIMIGPKGLARVVNALRVITPELPFEIEYRELNAPSVEEEFYGMKLHAFRANHNVPCFGYSVAIGRAGKFDPDAAKELKIPVKLWGLLQKGETVESDGRTFTPDLVMGPPRKGLKVTYCTDSRPTKAIVDAAKGSDLFICEGMYGEKEKFEKAKKNKHMTFYEAARMAKDAEVRELWLTHFSPSLVAPKRFMKETKKIFANAKLGRDGKLKELVFEDEKAKEDDE